MKWDEVNYLLHDFTCCVTYDTALSPVTHYKGRIYCPTPGSVAILRSLTLDNFRCPPQYAIVYKLSPPTPELTVF